MAVDLRTSKSPIFSGTVRLMRYQFKERRPLPRRCSRDSGAMLGHFESSKSVARASGTKSYVWFFGPVAFRSEPTLRCSMRLISASLYRHVAFNRRAPSLVRTSTTASGSVARGAWSPRQTEARRVQRAQMIRFILTLSGTAIVPYTQFANRAVWSGINNERGLLIRSQKNQDDKDQ